MTHLEPREASDNSSNKSQLIPTASPAAKRRLFCYVGPAGLNRGKRHTSLIRWIEVYGPKLQLLYDVLRLSTKKAVQSRCPYRKDSSPCTRLDGRVSEHLSPAWKCEPLVAPNEFWAHSVLQTLLGLYRTGFPFPSLWSRRGLWLYFLLLFFLCIGEVGEVRIVIHGVDVGVSRSGEEDGTKARTRGSKAMIWLVFCRLIPPSISLC